MTFDNHQQLQVSIFKRIILIVIVFLLILSIKNYIYSSLKLYVIEAVAGICGAIAYINFERWATPKKIDTSTMIFTNILCCLLLYILFVEELDSTSYIWLTSIPVMSYMLNGIKKGFILSFVYLSSACFMLIVKAYFIPSNFSIDNLLDIVFLIILLWFLSHYYEDKHRLSDSLLLEMATKDSLTGLNNRHAFYNYFDSNKYSTIGVILIDLDFFKAINDHYGHDAGDYMLIEVAQILRQYETDYIQAFRLGGEEFLLMTIDVSFIEVCKIANKILNDIRKHQYVHEGCLMELTASMGVQISENNPCNLTHLMKYADYKLYEAKQTGRNRVVTHLTDTFDLDKFGIHT